MSITRRTVSIALIALMLMTFFAVAMALTQESSEAAISKEVKKKAKKYKKKANKIVNIKGAKYCFSKKKVKTGQQKVKGKYYFFAKKDGKMVTNTAQKVGGDYYFFQKNGRRYNYAFQNAGSKEANDAAGMVISGAKIKVSGSAAPEEIRAAYRYIINKVDYGITLTPSNVGSYKWVGKEALAAATKKKAKCYGYAALTYSTFKALGADVYIYAGKCQQGPDGNFQEHAWTCIGTGDAQRLYDSVFDSTRAKDMTFYDKALVKGAEDGIYELDVNGIVWKYNI